jgi:dipeptidyl aminopeptidase/acylaminoacyl peptidase
LVSDAICAEVFLASRPLVDANRLHGLGVGVGAAVSASLACSEPRFRSLALLAPAYSAEPVVQRTRRFRFPLLPFGGEKNALGLSAGFAAEWAEQGFTRSYHELRVPVLLVHGNRDRVFPVSQSHLIRSAMEKSSQSVKFVSIEGCDHWFSHEEWQRLVAREICQWFSEALDGRPAAFA